MISVPNTFHTMRAVIFLREVCPTHLIILTERVISQIKTPKRCSHNTPYSKMVANKLFFWESCSLVLNISATQWHIDKNVKFTLFLLGLSKVRMWTADNYRMRKIRKDQSFSSFNLRTIACNLYPWGLVFIQKWQVPKHLDLKGGLMSGTLCKTNLVLRVLKCRLLATLLMPCCQPKFLVALIITSLQFLVVLG